MDKVLFFKSFLRSPLQVASLIPSSPFLVNHIARHVNQLAPLRVAELGAGTGVLTRALVDECPSIQSLLVFENEKNLKNHLRNIFPRLPVYADAFALHEAMQEQGIGQLDCIISALPVSWFSAEQNEYLMELVYRCLKPGGAFIMFQFSLQMRKYLRMTFQDIKIKYVPLNFLPAFVYYCYKM
ncbi:class I SAM-dependent methyltransferase [Aneurinibacillus aneurinilyticus]|nr:rRNA adenine N-6-methyltransferase family protein [Aneurinibacillus aneurinilyticus]MCI1694475.1 methyltransferase [Aneurinibacillus aneurinilyticus]MED0670842.1 methyltransferase [Aneurinibacillus aneurinilyticus]MED0705553.1 methyltransferase [Aneurinibacillus aneurinilyticus]MED0724444.1 methyltransferase [Aneurinibacillus aneurinilyticus]MED0731279.1 methyltransferase [Aneurinibacillus aneurinilyticus]